MMKCTIKEVPSKIYLKALSVSNVPDDMACSMFVKRKETKGDVEYTLLNSIWRKPCEIPKFPCVIIEYADYGEGTRLDYAMEINQYEEDEEQLYRDSFGECTNAIAWCYASDILPKGGFSCAK